MYVFGLSICAYAYVQAPVIHLDTTNINYCVLPKEYFLMR